MPKIFEKGTPQYQAQTAETAYLKAQQQWDNRLGTLYHQAKLWQRIASILIILLLIAIGTLAIVASKRQEVVYVAQVKEGGQVVNVAPLMESYNPTQAQTEYFLGQFVTLVRGLPLDPVLAKQNWIKAYSYLTERGATQLNSLMQQNNPLSLLGKQTVSVTINSVNRLTPNSYEVAWTETNYDSQGQVVGKKTWSGVFSTTIIPPKTQQQIMVNPLGIMINNVSWSQSQ